MPELPEAESIARALNRALRKKKIMSVEVYAPKLRTPLAPLKTAGLIGRTFVGCRRRARYAVADLDDGRALTMHFGMSGVVRAEAQGLRAENLPDLRYGNRPRHAWRSYELVLSEVSGQMNVVAILVSFGPIATPNPW